METLRARLLRLAVDLRLARADRIADLRRGLEEAGIRSSFVVCSTPRTGSTMLAALLESTGVVGRPREWLGVRFTAEVLPRVGRRGFAGYIAECARPASATGVFGSKLHWYQAELLFHLLRLMRGARGLSDLELLEASLPAPRFVWLRREDAVAQAVSWWRATATGVWLHGAGSGGGGAPDFDVEGIEARIRHVRDQTEAWRRWFSANAVEPLELTYEELVENSDRATRRVLGHLDVEAPRDLVVEPLTQRQADAFSDEWARRYRELASARDALRT